VPAELTTLAYGALQVFSAIRSGDWVAAATLPDTVHTATLGTTHCWEATVVGFPDNTLLQQ
jgi:hypothetical protein